ncbi:MAG: toluene tolerance protein Ttg2 [Desulfobacteraceae bacterium 4572_89]|nr:MAG: toluene tolerance protein Ttg2 [Desulfobacteraceae bacterium 4572_89]
MKYIGKIMVVLVAVLGLNSGGVLAASPAQNQLKMTIDSILDVLGNPELNNGTCETCLRKQRSLLKQIVEKRFDFEKMSQLSLARHWKQRTNQEKSEFVALFSQLLEDTYINKIEFYNDEKVIYLKERIKNKKAQVDTKIITQTIEIPISYRMFTRGNDEWKIYDLIIEGVSLVGNYRSQFSQILEKNSFEFLLDKLKNKKKN